MKQIILITILFTSLFKADGLTLTLKSFNTNEDINISHISNYASNFIIEKQEKKDDEFEIILINSEENSTIKQNTTHKFRWIMFTLDNNLSSGNYWVEHTDFDFTKHTFNKSQFIDKFSLLGRRFFSFHYNKKKDSKQYFLKAINTKSHIVPMAKIYTPQSFSKWSNSYSLKMLFYFFLFGVIFMASIYNGALYLYNREKSFLYYMIMQFFMLGVLLYQTDFIQTLVMGDIENEEIAIFTYFIIVEVTMVFIVLFIRSFLETKKYLPFQDKILRYIFIATLIDLLLFFVPIMLIFKLYSFILLYVIWVAWLRLKQGYTPALFFIFGWSSLMIGVFISDFFEEDKFVIEPILIGSAIEAIFLAIAISFKIKEIKDEKDKQKGLMVHQSKLASMGEMLGNIAHQWRQPLTRLGYILMNIEAKDKDELHTKKLEEASAQIEFMSQTIDDFRNFYKPNKNKESFCLADETKKVITLINLEKIELQFKVTNEANIINYKNEYKQVILNLISNAKDVLLQREIKHPKIFIEIDEKSVKISDNAGGIKLQNIQQIFEPYFSTKKQGLGIGLYMSKLIIEKNMGGKMEVENGEEGAVFRVLFF